VHSMDNGRARASGQAATLPARPAQSKSRYAVAARDGTRFRILGPIEAWADEHRLSLGGPRQRTLLAFLLLNPNRGLTSDVLVDAVWGSRRSESHNRLAMAVARLRKALEPLNGSGGTPLQTVSCGYLLMVGPRELDSAQFSERLENGLRALNTGDPARAAASIDDALRLWRGTPLAEVCFEDFAQPELRRLEEMRLVALETRVEAELQLGHHAQLVGELEATLAQEPTRERVACQLMLALYRSGRQTDALDVYQRTRVHLATAFGLQPGPALAGLQSRILHHSSGLNLAGCRPPGALNAATSCSRPLPTRLILTSPAGALAPVRRSAA